ncbi:MAG: MarR family transcriptional regulator [Actinomycetota bacterium]|nr:MarR family transcriptional regulator [Actinomycetota bacterium]
MPERVPTASGQSRAVTVEEYRQLLGVRSGLRRFLRWSEDRANENGLTATQHQLLLAIKGHDDERGPTIGEVAYYLALKHNSVVGLIDRADAACLIYRYTDAADRRIVRLGLTPEADRRLAALSALHLEELARLAPEIESIWHDLGGFRKPRSAI